MFGVLRRRNKLFLDGFSTVEGSPALEERAQSQKMATLKNSEFALPFLNTSVLCVLTVLTGFDIDPLSLKLPYFSPDELLGLAFIRNMPDGRKFRASVAGRSKMTTLPITRRFDS